jgi:hypothetical protein
MEEVSFIAKSKIQRYLILTVPTCPAAWISKASKRQLGQPQRNRGGSKRETLNWIAVESTNPRQYLHLWLQIVGRTSPCIWPKLVVVVPLNWHLTDLYPFLKVNEFQMEEFTGSKE